MEVTETNFKLFGNFIHLFSAQDGTQRRAPKIVGLSTVLRVDS